MNAMERIEQELDKLIINPDFTDLHNIQDWFTALEIQGIEEYYEFEEQSYCRLHLVKKAEYELLLCCWRPGQKSKLHGHPNQGCLVKILKGATTEKVHYPNGSQETRCNLKGTTAYINDSIGLHEVWNATEYEAVSLHLYAPGGYDPNTKK